MDFDFLVGIFLGSCSQTGVPEKSAKPTTDNSPPIHRWDHESDASESVVRTAETEQLVNSDVSAVHFMDLGPIGPGTQH